MARSGRSAHARHARAQSHGRSPGRGRRGGVRACGDAATRPAGGAVRARAGPDARIEAGRRRSGTWWSSSDSGRRPRHASGGRSTSTPSRARRPGSRPRDSTSRQSTTWKKVIALEPGVRAELPGSGGGAGQGRRARGEPPVFRQDGGHGWRRRSAPSTGGGARPAWDAPGRALWRAKPTKGSGWKTSAGDRADEVRNRSRSGLTPVPELAVKARRPGTRRDPGITAGVRPFSVQVEVHKCVD